MKKVFSLGLAMSSLLLTLPAMAGNAAMSDSEIEAVNKRIQPVARFRLAQEEGAGAAAIGSRSGEQIYNGGCNACHDSGVANAPKPGDNAAWADRIPLGLDGLLASSIAGKNAMPPRGASADATDEELARAIAFMANQSGADFSAP